ncbi:hypothetical protein AN478_01960 [Thiohalorhabdus denitrificans]|uniref:Uncharacterized protein n=1 Tax=Thiohalorhabdus denitrificans TaxID=381306 RepID=A0A0P9CEL0_9GAMM|nr:hypothetical protein [Thiohalorhabdus denitrificans]KPV41371.1 hypothetical protein AN478_01960 [Thiohalorhabdus denitrificans]SCY24887.1 hypothetical protein SAMN05661077_1582 [Thiohalorhabdus denitrificans]
MALMRMWILAALALLAALPVHAEVTLEEDGWNAPEGPVAAARHPALNAVLSEYVGASGARVELAHDGESAGTAWAREVRDWLVVLGIPGSRIWTEAGGAEPGTLRLAVRPGGAER